MAVGLSILFIVTVRNRNSKQFSQLDSGITILNAFYSGAKRYQVAAFKISSEIRPLSVSCIYLQGTASVAANVPDLEFTANLFAGREPLK